MTECPTCKEWMLFEGRHVCAPVWKIWYEDHYGDELVEVRGHSAEAALEKWAEKYDRDDYLILCGDVIKVGISRDGGPITMYTVSGESVPKYTATEIDQPKATEKLP